MIGEIIMHNIILVSGGFDPIHSGHIKLIIEANKHGDVIVLLNSDKWLRNKKGKEFLENNLIDQISGIILNYKNFILWLGSISFLVFIFSLISIKWLVALIPSDYFIEDKRNKYQSSYPLTWLISIIIKNIVGYILIIGGILMLVLPGQGLFTIIIGLMLSNYPGKYFIERKFIAIPSVLKTINWLRKKSNKPPLEV